MSWLSIASAVFCLWFSLGACLDWIPSTGPLWAIAFGGMGLAILFFEWQAVRLRVLDQWTRRGLRLRVVRLRGVTWGEAYLGGPWRELGTGLKQEFTWVRVPQHFGPGAIGANRWADAMYDFDCAALKAEQKK